MAGACFLNPGLFVFILINSYMFPAGNEMRHPARCLIYKKRAYRMGKPTTETKTARFSIPSQHSKEGVSPHRGIALSYRIQDPWSLK